MISMFGVFILIVAIIILVVLVSSKRIRNLISGKADRAIEAAEKEDSDAVYRSALNQLRNDIKELSDLATEATAMAFEVQQEIEAQKDTLKTVESDLQLAVNAGNKEVGTALIDRKESVEGKIKELEERLADYQLNADETVKAREDMTQELTNLQDEYRQAKTLGKADKMMDRIRSRREGIANDDVSKSLASARSTTLRIKAERHAEKTAGAASMDAKIAELRKGASSSAAGAKFDALMAKK